MKSKKNEKLHPESGAKKKKQEQKQEEKPRVRRAASLEGAEQLAGTGDVMIEN